MSEENNEIICQLCGKVCNGIKYLAVHINKAHKFDKKEYYDLYFKKDENENICRICHKFDTKFKSLTKGYNDICSNINCINLKIKETKFKNHGDENYINVSKIKQTCLEKYGVEWYSKTDQYIDDIKNTSIEKYGVDHFTKAVVVIEKSKETCLERYGYEHASQSPIIKEKTILNNQIKYKVDYPLQLKQIQEKGNITCLERYGVKRYCQTNEFKEQCKETSLEKYGYISWNQSPKVKEKQRQSTFDKYGEYSYFQTQEFKEYLTTYCLKHFGVKRPSQNIEILQKMKKTCLERYGVDNPFKIPNFYDLYLKNNPNRIFGSYSKISQELFWGIYEQIPEGLQKECYFAELNKEYFINFKDNFLLYDFCITNKKIIIEFQGNYWHRNPKFYEATEENIRIWKRDKFKKQVAEENGFQVFYVWESDYKKDKDGIIQICLQFIILN